MTGTGTSTDPYIVENWGEFVTAAGKSGAYVSCPVDAVWDMNEIAPTGVSGVRLSCAQINGNGLTIKNIFSSDLFSRGQSGTTNVYDLNFLDIYMEGGAFATCHPSSGSIAFHRCRFSGIFTGASSLFYAYSIASPAQLDRCSISVQLMGEARVMGITVAPGNDQSCGIFTFCDLNLQGSGSTNGNRFTLINSRLRGVYPGTGLVIASVSQYSVLDIGITWGVNDTTPTKVLINTDKVASGITIPSGFIKVTTEQLRDAQYLSSIGFPVGVD